jgi:hypothetical protein
MEIDNFRIPLAMGQGDWKVIPEINDTKNEELNSIGYSGAVYGKKMSLQDYFDAEFRHDVKFKVELLRFNSGEYTSEYLITRVKL